MKAVLLTLVLSLSAATTNADSATRLSFAVYEVFLDSAEPVAAWQFEFTDLAGSARIVGVENGASAAYRSAPYYDQQAVQRGDAERVIVADFSLDEEQHLPSGHFRLATIHVVLNGTSEPRPNLKLITAINTQGQVLDALLTFDATKNNNDGEPL